MNPSKSTATRHRFLVPAAQNGDRLDRILAANVPGLSRGRARLLLDLGGVFVERTRVKVASKALRTGQLVEVYLGGALERATSTLGRQARAADDAKLPAPQIVHIDPHLVVIDKPAALISAPTPESDRGNARALLASQLGEPVFVVHRLDLGTSGLLVYARSAVANSVLSTMFQHHDLVREYLALLHGRAAFQQQAVRVPIAGRAATTHFTRIEQRSVQSGPVTDWLTVVRCRLETGRTHQIRIHAQHLGHSVLGDRQHGDGKPPPVLRPPRLSLHATRLAFCHPMTGAALDFQSPLPPDLAGYLSQYQLEAAIDVQADHAAQASDQ